MHGWCIPALATGCKGSAATEVLRVRVILCYPRYFWCNLVTFLPIYAPSCGNFLLVLSVPIYLAKNLNKPISLI